VTRIAELGFLARPFAGHGAHTGYTIFQWVAQLKKERFAGPKDWRIPNIKELQSIVDYGNSDPVVATAFNTNCSRAGTPAIRPI
jgi:hypothetical protein